MGWCKHPSETCTDSDLKTETPQMIESSRCVQNRRKHAHSELHFAVSREAKVVDLALQPAADHISKCVARSRGHPSLQDRGAIPVLLQRVSQNGSPVRTDKISCSRRGGGACTSAALACAPWDDQPVHQLNSRHRVQTVAFLRLR